VTSNDAERMQRHTVACLHASLLVILVVAPSSCQHCLRLEALVAAVAVFNSVADVKTSPCLQQMHQSTKPCVHSQAIFRLCGLSVGSCSSAVSTNDAGWLPWMVSPWRYVQARPTYTSRSHYLATTQSTVYDYAHYFGMHTVDMYHSVKSDSWRRTAPNKAHHVYCLPDD
jgi:hypothetical protein